MIKTDKLSFTYKSFKEDSSILFRQIIDLAVENSSLEFDYPKEYYDNFSPICLDIKNCKILLPDYDYRMKKNWDRNSIMLGYINDFSFTVVEIENNEKFKIKALRQIKKN